MIINSGVGRTRLLQAFSAVLLLGSSFAALAAIEADASRWQTITEEALTVDGKWLIYIHKQGVAGPPDSVVQRSIDDKTQRRHDCGSKGRIWGLALASDSKHIAFITMPLAGGESAACLFDLSSGAGKTFAGYSSAQFIGQENRLLLKGEGRAMVMSANGERAATFETSEVFPDPNGVRMAIASKGSIVIYDLATAQTRDIDAVTEATYSSVAWAPSGRSLAMIREAPTGLSALVVVRDVGASKRQQMILEAKSLPGFPTNLRFARLPESLELPPLDFSPIVWRNDENAFFVGTRGQEPKPQQVRGFGPIVYRSDEALLPLERPNVDHFTGVGLVRLEERRFVPLSSPLEMVVSTAKEGNFALGLLWKPYDGPRFRRRSGAGDQLGDLVRIDLRSGERVVVRERLPFYLSNTMALAPNGRHFIYGIDQTIYALDVESGEERSFDDPALRGGFAAGPGTRQVEQPSYSMLSYRLFSPVSASWTRTGSAVVEDGAGDLWELDPVQLGSRRLTDGKGQFRYEPFGSINENTDSRILGALDLEAGFDIVVTDKDNASMALGRWTSAEAPPKSGPWYAGQLSCIEVKNRSAVCARTMIGMARDLYAANGYKLGARLTDLERQRNGVRLSPGAQHLTYSDGKGGKLHTAVILPFGYRPGVRYPAIAMSYFGPSSASIFFARSEPDSRAMPYLIYYYTQAGYAVILPDGVEEIDRFGASLADTIGRGISAAVDTGIVDGARIGFYSHSHGGWQALYLASTTRLFRAVVADAGMSDLVSLSNDNWHDQHVQALSFLTGGGFRFSKPLWENWSGYLENSPMRHAVTMDTPLLMISGDADGNVPYQQSLYYFNLLKMLGKPATYLHYPGVDHFAEGSNVPAWRDILRRKMEFFGHHLRGGSKPDWLVIEGTP